MKKKLNKFLSIFSAFMMFASTITGNTSMIRSYAEGTDAGKKPKFEITNPSGNGYDEYGYATLNTSGKEGDAIKFKKTIGAHQEGDPENVYPITLDIIGNQVDGTETETKINPVNLLILGEGSAGIQTNGLIGKYEKMYTTVANTVNTFNRQHPEAKINVSFATFGRQTEPPNNSADMIYTKDKNGVLVTENSLNNAWDTTLINQPPNFSNFFGKTDIFSAFDIGSMILEKAPDKGNRKTVVLLITAGDPMSGNTVADDNVISKWDEINTYNVGIRPVETDKPGSNSIITTYNTKNLNQDPLSFVWNKGVNDSKPAFGYDANNTNYLFTPPISIGNDQRFRQGPKTNRKSLYYEYTFYTPQTVDSANNIDLLRNNVDKELASKILWSAFIRGEKFKREEKAHLRVLGLDYVPPYNRNFHTISNTGRNFLNALDSEGKAVIKNANNSIDDVLKSIIEENTKATIAPAIDNGLIKDPMSENVDFYIPAGKTKEQAIEIKGYTSSAENPNDFKESSDLEKALTSTSLKFNEESGKVRGFDYSNFTLKKNERLTITYKVAFKTENMKEGEPFLTNGTTTLKPKASEDKTGNFGLPSFTIVPTKVNLTIEKKWLGKQPEVNEITVNIKDGEQVKQTVVLKKDKGWKVSFSGDTALPAPKSGKYTVEEVNKPDGYSVEYAYSNKDKDYTAIITNSNPDTTSIKFEKMWKRFKKADASITLKVVRSVEGEPLEVVKGYDVSNGIGHIDDESFVVTEPNGEYTISKLPKYKIENGEAKEYKYSVKEVSFTSNDNTYTLNDNGTIINNVSVISNIKNENNKFILSNENNEKFNIQILTRYKGTAPSSGDVRAITNLVKIVGDKKVKVGEFGGDIPNRHLMWSGYPAAYNGDEIFKYDENGQEIKYELEPGEVSPGYVLTILKPLNGGAYGEALVQPVYKINYQNEKAEDSKGDFNAVKEELDKLLPEVGTVNPGEKYTPIPLGATEYTDAAQDGKWLAKQWATNEITPTADTTLTATWTFVPNKHTIKIEFAKEDGSPDIPGIPPAIAGRITEEIATQEGIKDATLKVPETTEYIDNENDGKWTFEGWELVKLDESIKKNVKPEKIGTEDVIYRGIWKFIPNKHSVSFSFEKKEITMPDMPNELTNKLPATITDKIKGDKIQAPEGLVANTTTVADSTNDGVWTFNGWDKSFPLTIEKDNINVIGKWLFEATKRGLTYSFTKENGVTKNLPEILTTASNNNTYVPVDPNTYTRGQKVVLVDPKPTTYVDTEQDGDWTFIGYRKKGTNDKPELKEVTFGSEAEEVEGVWNFTPYKHPVNFMFEYNKPANVKADVTKHIPSDLTSKLPSTTDTFAMGAKVEINKLNTNPKVSDLEKDKTEIQDSNQDGKWKFIGWKNNEIDMTNSKEGITFVGKWDFVPNLHKLSFKFDVKKGVTKALPESITKLVSEDGKLPVEISNVVKDQEINHPIGLETDKTTVSDQNNDGVWKFIGWNPTFPYIVGTSDTVITGTWDFVANEYQTKFVPEYTQTKDTVIKATENIPDEVKNLNPTDSVNYKLGDKVTIPEPTKKEVEDINNDGTWKFKGYRVPKIDGYVTAIDSLKSENLTDENGTKNLVITPEWEFTPNKHKIEYEYVYNVAEGTIVKPTENIPKDLTDKLPKSDKEYVKGTRLHITDPQPKPVPTETGTKIVDTFNDGVWNFVGWDNENIEIGNNNGKFVGTWNFIPNKHKVIYDYISNSSRDLPDELKKWSKDSKYVMKDDKDYIKGQEVKIQNPIETEFSTTSGRWDFLGYKLKDSKDEPKKDFVTQMNDKNIEVVGVWEFTPKKKKPKKDRIDTAIEISKNHYGKSDIVIVCRNDLYPDSLTATVLSKQLNAPILLTHVNRLDERVKDEISRLGAKHVIIVGGPNSVSEYVKEEIRQLFDKSVERISGRDRYGTSEMVARRVVGLTGVLHKAVVASGEVFPDALSISPFAAYNGYPILLIRYNQIPNEIKSAIKDLKINETYVIGGYNTISKNIYKKLPSPIERIAGIDRYETAVKIAESKFKDANKAFVASGEVFSDALVIGPVAGKYNDPVLLVRKNPPLKTVKDYIQKSNLKNFEFIGGENTISISTRRYLESK